MLVHQLPRTYTLRRFVPVLPSDSMRAPSSMMLHVLRQHAAQIYRQPGLQVHPLFSVLPHLLRPEVSSLVSLSSFSTAAGSSTQVVEPQFKVFGRLISLEPAEFALPARPSPHMPTHVQSLHLLCSAQTCSTRIQDPCNMTGPQTSPDLR